MVFIKQCFHSDGSFYPGGSRKIYFYEYDFLLFSISVIKLFIAHDLLC